MKAVVFRSLQLPKFGAQDFQFFPGNVFMIYRLQHPGSTTRRKHLRFSPSFIILIDQRFRPSLSQSPILTLLFFTIHQQPPLIPVLPVLTDPPHTTTLQLCTNCNTTINLILPRCCNNLRTQELKFSRTIIQFCVIVEMKINGIIDFPTVPSEVLGEKTMYRDTLLETSVTFWP